MTGVESRKKNDFGGADAAASQKEAEQKGTEAVSFLCPRKSYLCSWDWFTEAPNLSGRIDPSQEEQI